MPDTSQDTMITVATLAVDLQYIRAKIDQICVDSKSQDDRLDKLERVTWLVSGVGSLIAAIFIPIAVAAIRKWLGL